MSITIITKRHEHRTWCRVTLVAFVTLGRVAAKQRSGLNIGQAHDDGDTRCDRYTRYPRYFETWLTSRILQESWRYAHDVRDDRYTGSTRRVATSISTRKKNTYIYLFVFFTAGFFFAKQFDHN